MRNFATNIIYLYDRMPFTKKNTVINKIVPDFMDTLYMQTLLDKMSCLLYLCAKFMPLLVHTKISQKVPEIFLKNF